MDIYQQSNVSFLLFNMLSRLVIAFLSRSKCLLISWLQSLSTLSFWSLLYRPHFNTMSQDRTIVKTKCLFSSVQLLSRVWLSVTPWIAARQASLFITNSRSSLKLMSIESVMPSSHLILCRPLLFLPPIPPSRMPWSSFSECWALSQLFHSPLSLNTLKVI